MGCCLTATWPANAGSRFLCSLSFTLWTTTLSLLVGPTLTLATAKTLSVSTWTVSMTICTDKVATSSYSSMTMRLQLATACLLPTKFVTSCLIYLTSPRHYTPTSCKHSNTIFIQLDISICQLSFN